MTLRQRQSEPSRVAQLYQQELQDLREQLEELNRDKNCILIERSNMHDELQVEPLGGFKKMEMEYADVQLQVWSPRNITFYMPQ